MAKELKKYLLICAGFFTIFLIGYVMGRYDNNIYMAISQNEKNGISEALQETQVSSLNIHSYEIVGNSVVEFRINCGNHEWKVEREESLSSLGLENADIMYIKNKYADLGYKIIEVQSNKIVFERYPIKYYPNKYVIGIENGDLIICKTGQNGEIFDLNGEYLCLEEYGNTGVNLKKDDIDDEIINKIIVGHEDMQFDTVEEAMYGITNIIE